MTLCEEITKDQVYVSGCCESEANGLYDNVDKETMSTISMTFYGNNIEYLFQHTSNEQNTSFYAIIKCKLESNGKNDIVWIIIHIKHKINIHTIKELTDTQWQLLYIAKARLCGNITYPPSLNWKSVIFTNKSTPLISKHRDSYGKSWSYKFKYKNKDIQCSETDFNDMNIYNAIPTDIESYSTQHSYYKHLQLEGEYHTIVPINGGQRRNRQESPLYPHQIRWHVRDVKWLSMNQGKDEIEDLNDWLWIKQIAIKHKFKLNCFLGGNNHGNWSIAIRKNKNAIAYLNKKYPQFDGQFSMFSNSKCTSMIYQEEHEEQVENAILCGRKIYMEIKEYVQRWKNVAVCWSIIYNAPMEISTKIGGYCDIVLKDWYIDEANNTWRM